MPTKKQRLYLAKRFPMCFYVDGLYSIEGRMYRFKRVTEKGFNFVANGECLLRRHLYSRKHGNLPLPNNLTQVHVMMPGSLRPNYMGISHKEYQV